MAKPETNQAAFRRLKPEIDRRYPAGHWIAIKDGRLIADAPNVGQLEDALRASGQDSVHVFCGARRCRIPRGSDHSGGTRLMIAPAVTEQRSPYKGEPPRPWIRAQILRADGQFRDLDLVADTGSPLPLIVGLECLLSFRSKETPDVMSNFGRLDGGLLHVAIPELGFDARIEAFGGDRLTDALRRSHEDFGGVVGLPLLRMFEYGGDWDAFWVVARSAQA